jgi:hypothetical protein
MNKTPEQLRVDYLAAEQRRDAELTRKGKRNYRKWMVVGFMASAIAALVNYLEVSPMILAHAAYGAIAAALLVRLKRGPWTGIALIGLGNEVISLCAGTMSLLGFLLFLPAGGLIGFTMYVEREP